MNYRMRRQGEDLGVFSLEELRRRRESGELSGTEYIQGEGMPDWQPLDLVLQRGYRVIPPPLPPSASRGGPSQGIIWLIIGGGVIFFIVLVTFFAYMAINFQHGYQAAIRSSRGQQRSDQYSTEGVAVASQPVIWTTNTLTERDVQKRAREFRIRQWLDGYEKRGWRNPACDAEAMQFIRVWIDRNYGGPEATNTLLLDAESDRLANNPNCTDPLVLTVAADNSLNYYDSVRRFERALAAYPKSNHRAYPQFYAAVRLMSQLNNNSDQAGELDTSALELLPKCFADGSFIPDDQQEIAEIFVNGWGYNFFNNNAAAVCKAVHQAGPPYRWLALTLDGEREINEAWAARGSGWANTVTKEGWQGFSAHLAKAREDLTQAWKMHPDFPLAPRLMMTVALGDPGPTDNAKEMRVWFDRTLLAQVDYPGAWHEMRWGLRPRWYGSEAAMLALGRTAINTGRFDTEVPYQFFNCVADVESEMDLPPGRHIYDRSDIWPEFQKMYEGYINASAQPHWGYLNRWRTAYAVVAYFAGKYNVARKQLQALSWEPAPANLRDWGVDLSLMPLEVAARTGPLGTKISAAEDAYGAGDVTSAFKQYSDLLFAPDSDTRTREFINYRLAQITIEDRLHQGKWVDWMPANDHDLDWVFSFGKARRLTSNALEVEYGPKGHMLFSRANVGASFEVRGQFEVVHSSNKNFQAGLVMGTPDFDNYNWYGFRIKRHDVEGDVVCVGVGWSRRAIVQHVVLNDVTNSFDFVLRNGRVTASVNGLEVFHQAALPGQIEVPNNTYLVGLGAFSDSEDTVIRYRNVQLRRLP
ncbi:MAG TPA: DUF4339 domain-containing protein [Candidatus Saccharimonadales bacterium]|nr:DUF4339 domain-containing protein [Candidatus Saccharimonadales bacterium]